MSKHIPILFSTAMVQAKLAGRKTMTRRVIKLADGSNPNDEDISWYYHDAFGGDDHGRTLDKVMDFTKTYPYWKECKCPYGQPGDVLWTRENWRMIGWDFEDPTMLIEYEAGGTENCELHDPTEDSMWLLNHVEVLENKGIIAKSEIDPDRFVFTEKNHPFKPSIHMPKAACRMCDKVKAVRVERLQDISEEDAMAEGVFYHAPLDGYVTDMEGRNYHGSSAVESFAKLWISINGVESWEANPWVWVVEFEPCEMPSDFLTRKNS